MANNTYFTERKKHDFPNKFACLVFIKRDFNVAQWFGKWERY